MKRFVPVLLLAALCGCGTPYYYSPYVGQQQAWTTQSGAFVRVVDGATFYPPGQFPDRPYIVLGSASGGNEHDLAKAVHEQKADAALIYTEQTYRSGTVAVAGPAGYWGSPIYSHVARAQLIRFK